jgi:nucleotide-binding universal stress UspA family protein
MESKFYRKMLIATDGSESARSAVYAGIELARLIGAKIQAAYVIDTFAYSSMPKDTKWEKAMYDQLKELGKEAISYVESSAGKKGVKIETLILEGHPAEEILNFAEKQNIDMIVVGSLGKTDVERFLLGSVSEKVVRNAKASVLIIHAKNLSEA